MIFKSLLLNISIEPIEQEITATNNEVEKNPTQLLGRITNRISDVRANVIIKPINGLRKSL